MSLPDWIMTAYLSLAAIACVATWIVTECDESESGVLTGLTWPVWTLILLIALVAHGVSFVKDRRP